MSQNFDSWSIPKRKHTETHDDGQPPPQDLGTTAIPRKPKADKKRSWSSQGEHMGFNPAFGDTPRQKPSSSSSSKRILSHHPFVVRLDLQGVPLTQGIPPPILMADPPPRAARTSTDSHRGASKRTVRPSYKEAEEYDDFWDDSDDEEVSSKKKKKLKKVPSKSSVSTGAPGTSTGDQFLSEDHVVAPAPKASASSGTSSTALLALNDNSMEAPPPGFLSTLWYSRECFLPVLVLEKVLAWKVRPRVQLKWSDPSSDEHTDVVPHLSPADAAKWSSMALVHPRVASDQHLRMEVSRLVPEKCPVVMAMACAAQPSDSPSFVLHTPALPKQSDTANTLEFDTDTTEEVYLVKWRGRSHWHASWERGSDILKYDHSTNNTARHKIRRFVQAQEIAFGKNWKSVLLQEQAPANIGAGNEHVTEEYFPPAMLEIERILACDESEMDMKLFSKQRAYNIREEQQREAERAKGIHWNYQQSAKDLLTEVPWDPEDNVRYVVKWKGLPYAEMTWEYWRDIKRDAVEDAFDFWNRQVPPDPATWVPPPHPQIREFRKMQESPVFGLSYRERPVDQSILKDSPTNDTNDDEEPTQNAGFRLRGYQLEGVNWLLFNWWNKRSCILADEMGLGKTIQTMCFLKSLQDLPATGVRGPFLIVAPLSLIGQWQSEAQSWAPDLNVVLYHGSADARDFLVKQDFFYNDQFVPKQTATKLKKQHVTKFHILITTYEVVLKDANVFSKIQWRALVVDEAHRLKNSKSRLFEDLGTVPRDFCLLLTGTPLANATEELWALLHFADKKAFANKDEFLEKFGQLTDANQVKELHTVLKPYLLRRVKEDVEKSLPPKEETILEVSLTPIQKKYYKAIYERNTAFLYKGSKPSNAPSLMNVMMELRKCCNHPYLVRGAEERILADAAGQTTPDGNPMDPIQLFGDQLIKSSGKMVLINKLLPKLFSNGHKVLIFSQMVRVLDLLEELLKIMKYKYERLDGSTSSSSRAAAVDRFCRKSCQRFVMLLSTRAGGLGLNLTAADIVIIFDSDWNPQNDLQAMARAHRIGQTRAVRVYRLLTAKTYEMHMFHSASMKLGLERAVLSQQREQGEEGENGKSKTKSEKEAQAKEIDSLLKKGAYDVFKEEDDLEAQKFMETDIDQLLESNAQTVTYGKDQSSMSSGLGSFSKASFVADTGDGEKDVDLDDPDFWKKAAGLEAPVETPDEVAQMLDDGVKRSRKQVQQFDPFADFAEIEQRKEDKKNQKIREEKEEKERARIEKKMKKMIEKEQKKKENDSRVSLFGKNKTAVSKTKPVVKFKLKKKSQLPLPLSSKDPKVAKDLSSLKEFKSKKPKKSGERKRAQIRSQNEDPMIERLKQAWDLPQRNRALAACLRFGFERFCKIRSEANLMSLPIQDIEVLFRSYFYQLCLQLVVAFVQMMKHEDVSVNEDNLRDFLSACLGVNTRLELDWLSDCISKGMKEFLQIENVNKFYRLPAVLAETTFVSELRRGAALRSLRRIFVSGRVNRVVSHCLDEILVEMGYEQLGKRGCPTSNLASMDADLKARLVSSEELSLALSVLLGDVKLRQPVAWWDRGCDIALIIGTFVHGLGNYEAMQNDDSLPFSFNIRRFAVADEACAEAQSRFLTITKAAKLVFYNALEAAKIKDQLQIQAAVAAAAATSKEREKDALALREGGDAAGTVAQQSRDTPADKLYDTEGDDSHFITLPRLRAAVLEALLPRGTLAEGESSEVVPSEQLSGDESAANEEKTSGRRKQTTIHALSMPDSRILNHRLGVLLTQIERNTFSDDQGDNGATQLKTPIEKLWPSTDVVSQNNRVKTEAFSKLLGVELNADEMSEFQRMGIGINPTQCGSSHRGLDSGSDYYVGSASSELAQTAYGSDAPRYLRAICVPMNMTRFAVCAIVHADELCTLKLMETERIRSARSRKENMKQVTSDEVVEVKEDPSDDNKASSEIPSEKTDEKAEEKGDEKDVPDDAKSGAADVAQPESASEVEEKPVPEEDPIVPTPFASSQGLRSAVCNVVMLYGIPTNVENERVSEALWKNIREQCITFDNEPAAALFGSSRFMTLVKEVVDDSVEIPPFSDILAYVKECLLPHCLRLCLMGNGPVMDNARGSRGEYDTAYGISVYQEPTDCLQCNLPDPCLSLEEHSVDAVASAYAILRRAQLMQSAMELVSGKISIEALDDVLRSSFLRKSMDGLPMWWCPWIHDAALLIHATTRGLFSVLRDRHDPGTTSLAFSERVLRHHIENTFVSGASALPRAALTHPSEDTDEWINYHTKTFPSINIMERRLAFLCAKASEMMGGDCTRYANLPMFDHGAWPRN